MNELTTTKLCITLGIFLISLLSSAAPMTLSTRKLGDNNNTNFLLSVGNMFAAGVLLAAGFVHQLPDAITALENAVAADFPVATFITGLIFCFFVIVEECIHTSSTNPFDDKHKVVADHACEKLVVAVEDQNTDHKNNNTPNTTHNFTTIGSDHSHTHTHIMHSERTKLLLPEHKNVAYNNDKEYNVVESLYEPNCRIAELLFLRSAISPLSVCGEQQELSKRVLSIHNNDQNSSSSSSARRSHDTTLFELSLPTNNEYDNENPVVHYQTGGSFTSSIILLLALSIHSILEGLGIGISSTTTELTSITAAVLAHKAFAGYALGSAMVASGTLNNQQIVILCAVFSSCGSVGVGIGMILHDAVDPENSIPIGIIQAMVAGTFLYVAIVEIAMKELSMMTTNTAQHPRNNTTLTKGIWEVRSKLVAFLVGYLLMSVLAIWV